MVDACAAPGNKSTHAAALLRGRGKVLAVDRDAARLKILEEEGKEARASDIVQAVRGDFLSCATARARAILVDPSCSGGFEGEAASDARVARLAEFQSKALRAALTRFPRAERVSYSTCSLRIEEDEAVVAGALADADIKGGGWRLAPARRPAAARPAPRGLDRAQSDRLRAPGRRTRPGRVLRRALPSGPPARRGSGGGRGNVPVMRARRLGPRRHGVRLVK